MSRYFRPWAVQEARQVRLYLTPFSSQYLTPERARQLAADLTRAADSAEQKAGA